MQPSAPVNESPSPVASPAKPDRGYRSISVRRLTKAQLDRLKERARNVDISMEEYVRSLITDDDRIHAILELAEEIENGRLTDTRLIAKKLRQTLGEDDGTEEIQTGT